MPHKVSLEAVKSGLQLILSSLPDDVDDVSIDVDYYWDVDPLRRYLVTPDQVSSPPQLNLGQISSDIEVLGTVEEPENLTGYHLVCLASILRVIGERGLVPWVQENNEPGQTP